MLKRLTTAPSLSAAFVATGPSVAMTKAPMLYESYGIFRYFGSGVTGTPTILIEGSYDSGSTWTTLRTIPASEIAFGYSEFELQLYPLTRANVTVAGTAGTFTVYGSPQPPG